MLFCKEASLIKYTNNQSGLKLCVHLTLGIAMMNDEEGRENQHNKHQTLTHSTRVCTLCETQSFKAPHLLDHSYLHHVDSDVFSLFLVGQADTSIGGICHKPINSFKVYHDLKKSQFQNCGLAWASCRYTDSFIRPGWHFEIKEESLCQRASC